MHACTFEGCEKQFKSLASYNAHVKTHTNEQPHPCTYEGCGKRFAKASKLKLHIRTHTGERPYACEVEVRDLKVLLYPFRCKVLQSSFAKGEIVTWGIFFDKGFKKYILLSNKVLQTKYFSRVNKMAKANNKNFIIPANSFYFSELSFTRECQCFEQTF